MRALTVTPGVPGSARLTDVDEPLPAEGDVLVATEAVGVCGTDREIVAGDYGTAPPGSARLVLGHEALGRVVTAPPSGALRPGDLVVPMVRVPDPVPCTSCAAGEWDMCRNGRYLEHGIKGLPGFARARFRTTADRLVTVDGRLGRAGVLLEPASVVAKAWEHIEAIGSRSVWQPQRVLVTGAGPIGLLAALAGRQRGLEVHVADIVTAGPKPGLVSAIGAEYHGGSVQELDLEVDVVIECTGAVPVIAAVLGMTGPNGMVCLTGVSVASRRDTLDLGALNREWVLDNDVVFGSVNANRRHYEAAAESLARADHAWLAGLITREVPVEDFATGLEVGTDDVKTVLTF